MREFNFKKKFGQNFLKDSSVVSRIVSSSNILDDTLVIEVGPGAGIMTKEIAKVAKNVLCYEIDLELEDTLISNLKDYDNVDIIFDDFLNRNILDDLSKYDYKHLYFISNVPYYITTPILLKIMDEEINVEKIVMMVQKEVGDRFSASPGKKDYSSITVFLNYYFNISSLFDVNRNLFYPVPNVDSVIISFERRDKVEYLKNKELFFKLVRDSFKFKRKTIRNNLKNYPLEKVENVLKRHNYNLNVRAEELSFLIFVEISNEL